jgi:hypothetical protein
LFFSAWEKKNKWFKMISSESEGHFKPLSYPTKFHQKNVCSDFFIVIIIAFCNCIVFFYRRVYIDFFHETI